jgi:hypothetical protein
MKNQKSSATPTSTMTMLEKLESIGLGDGPYANALRKGLAEEKERPGMGRASFTETLISPEDRVQNPKKRGER